jgi:hypothetical protein
VILNPYDGKPIETDEAKAARTFDAVKAKALLVEAFGALVGLHPNGVAKSLHPDPVLFDADCKVHRDCLCQAIAILVGKAAIENRWPIRFHSEDKSE